ncbi:MAG: cytochrome c peroxidase [Planctomycetota bacterium]
MRVLFLVVPIALAASARAQALGPPPTPPENPITEPKRILGKALFWDEQLSSDNTVACGTCHIPSAGGSDPRLEMDSRHPGLDGIYGGEDDRFASRGVRRADVQGHYEPDPLFGFEAQVTGRRSPTNLGAAFFDELFWDGRAGDTFIDPLTNLVSIPSGGALESQSLGPILSFVEMADDGRTWSDVTSKLERIEPLALATNLNPDLTGALAAYPDYPALFAAAFGDSTITPERIAFALATYQRTLHPDQTPWDLYEQGQTTALTPQEIQGMNSFFSSSNRCADCHAAPLFSDGSYRNIGLRAIAEDNGRQGVTGDFADRGKFKVPTLRNAGLRTRFFHNGDPTFNTLFVAVFLYNQGAGFFLDNKDPILNSVFMSPTTAGNITAFIEGGLTDPRVAAELPPFDRPTLRSELEPSTTLLSSAREGSGGFTPTIVATAPTMVGNAEFRVGVHDALGGAAALLVVTVATPSTTPYAPHALGQRLAFPFVLGGVGSGEGHATWTYPIPSNTALVGSQVRLRWLIADPGAINGLAYTQNASATLF